MKRALFAAAALVLLSTPASAYELNCAAPRVALGDEPDSNPVVSVDIRYIPEDHSWRIFHNRRDGLVVSRSEQYAVQDASTDSKAQWQGPLNRARHLYMIGEVKRVDGVIVYMEWMYDRKKGNQLVMQASARCAMATPPQTEASMLFVIPSDVPAGHMNVRNGPGANHGLLGAIPAGQTVGASRCAPRDDGIAGADWCFVAWNGLTGWVSRVGLMPISEQPAPSLPRPSAQAPVTPRPPVVTSDRPVTRVKDSVPIYSHADGEATKIDVLVGGLPLRMLLDTGATLSLISDAVASRLIHEGNAERQKDGLFTMADGSQRRMPVILIYEVRIGRHLIRNVRAGVSADQILIAFPVVNDIAPFTIDTRAGELVFHTAANS